MTRWFLLGLVVTLLAVPARAVDCPVPEGSTPALAAQSAEARLAYLSRLLEEEGAAAQRWTLAWGATYGVATLAQLGVAGLFPAEERPDWYWGALSTAVGVAFTVLGPLEVMDAGPRFATRMKGVSADGTCALLAEGERLLREGADAEVQSNSWLLHAGNVLFNVAIGLVLGLGYGHWVTGAVNGAIGVAVGEATIFTAPNRLAPGWQQYRGGAVATASGVSFRLVPTIGPGLALRGEF
jgi:hypothetical protein